MDYEKLICLVEQYTNNEGVFDDFDVAMEFMNTIGLTGDDERVSVPFYRYVCDYQNDDNRVGYLTALAAEKAEDASLGRLYFILDVSEETLEWTTRYVVEHVPTGRFMSHTASPDSYNDGYTMETKWVEVIQYERTVIDYKVK